MVQLATKNHQYISIRVQPKLRVTTAHVHQTLPTSLVDSAGLDPPVPVPPLEPVVEAGGAIVSGNEVPSVLEPEIPDVELGGMVVVCTTTVTLVV